ncbi:MAG: hypothetical protein HQK53_08755 [Oligoflexia bacterium]|nr:hypothetical protein [Oligoflexia bacterium]
MVVEGASGCFFEQYSSLLGVLLENWKMAFPSETACVDIGIIAVVSSHLSLLPKKRFQRLLKTLALFAVSIKSKKSKNINDA